MGDYANDAVMMVMAIMAAADEGDDEPRVRLKEHWTGDAEHHLVDAQVREECRRVVEAEGGDEEAGFLVVKEAEEGRVKRKVKEGDECLNKIVN